MKLRNLGDGAYALGETGWTVRRETLDSTSIWTVHDPSGVEQFYDSTRKEAVGMFVRMIREDTE